MTLSLSTEDDYYTSWFILKICTSCSLFLLDLEILICQANFLHLFLFNIPLYLFFFSKFSFFKLLLLKQYHMYLLCSTYIKLFVQYHRTCFCRFVNDVSRINLRTVLVSSSVNFIPYIIILINTAHWQCCKTLVIFSIFRVKLRNLYIAIHSIFFSCFSFKNVLAF